MNDTTDSLRAHRRGFTLIELLVTLAIFGVVMTSAISFLLAQTKGFRQISSRSDQIQNGRFSRDVMRQELRAVGTNVTVDQPMTVYASDSVFAFNADLLTNLADSARFTGAIYVDPFATANEAAAMQLSAASAIPGSGFVYPMANYSQAAGTIGDAETVIFRFTKDTGSTDPNAYMLLRRVNGNADEVLASGIRKAAGAPFFRYWYDPTRYSSTATTLDTVPRAWLPLAKTVALRGVFPDTGTAITTRIDQLRGVEVAYESTKNVAGRTEIVRYMVPMPNTAIEQQARACGRPPIDSPSPTAVWRPDSLAVMLTWTKAVDDGAGELDAVRYVIWRRVAGAANWGTALASVSAKAGASGYTYKDTGVETGLGRSYEYGVAVQDCTPNVSGVSGSAPVVVP